MYPSQQKPGPCTCINHRDDRLYLLLRSRSLFCVSFLLLLIPSLQGFQLDERGAVEFCETIGRYVRVQYSTIILLVILSDIDPFRVLLPWDVEPALYGKAGGCVSYSVYINTNLFEFMFLNTRNLETPLRR